MRVRVEDWDAAAYLPSVIVPRREEGFVRFGIADGTRVMQSGIFVAAHATLRSPDTEDWASEEIQRLLDWFDCNMRAPRPGTNAARYFLRASAREMFSKLWELAHVLRTQGVFVEMISIRRPGRITVEDEVQVAAVPR